MTQTAVHTSYNCAECVLLLFFVYFHLFIAFCRIAIACRISVALRKIFVHRNGMTAHFTFHLFLHEVESASRSLSVCIVRSQAKP